MSLLRKVEEEDVEKGQEPIPEKGEGTGTLHGVIKGRSDEEEEADRISPRTRRSFSFGRSSHRLVKKQQQPEQGDDVQSSIGHRPHSSSGGSQEAARAGGGVRPAHLSGSVSQMWAALSLTPSRRGTSDSARSSRQQREGGGGGEYNNNSVVRSAWSRSGSFPSTVTIAGAASASSDADGRTVGMPPSTVRSASSSSHLGSICSGARGGQEVAPVAPSGRGVTRARPDVEIDIESGRGAEERSTQEGEGAGSSRRSSSFRRASRGGSFGGGNCVFLSPSGSSRALGMSPTARLFGGLTDPAWRRPPEDHLAKGRREGGGHVAAATDATAGGLGGGGRDSATGQGSLGGTLSRMLRVKPDLYYCQICFELQPLERGHSLSPCGHIFCGSCLRSYLTIKVKDGQLAPICFFTGEGTSGGGGGGGVGGGDGGGEGGGGGGSGSVTSSPLEGQEGAEAEAIEATRMAEWGEGTAPVERGVTAGKGTAERQGDGAQEEEEVVQVAAAPPPPPGGDTAAPQSGGGGGGGGGACGQVISEACIEHLLDAETFAKYLRFKFQNEHDDARECPKCDHAQIGSPTHPQMACAVCGFAYCFHHSNAHPDSSCAAYERSVAEENKQSAAVISTTCKPCPGCGTAVEKSGGCNQMKCFRCNTSFCWVCLAKVDEGTFPTHYQWWNVAGCPNQQLQNADGNNSPNSQRWYRGMALFLIVLIGPAALGCTITWSLACCCLLPLFGLPPRDLFVGCVSNWGYFVLALLLSPFILVLLLLCGLVDLCCGRGLRGREGARASSSSSAATVVAPAVAAVATAPDRREEVEEKEQSGHEQREMAPDGTPVSAITLQPSPHGSGESPGSVQQLVIQQQEKAELQEGEGEKVSAADLMSRDAVRGEEIDLVCKSV